MQKINGPLIYIFRKLNLLSNVGLSTFDSLRAICEKDFGSPFSDKEWSSVCANIFPNNTSISAKEQNFLHLFKRLNTSSPPQKVSPTPLNYVLNVKQPLVL